MKSLVGLMKKKLYKWYNTYLTESEKEVSMKGFLAMHRLMISFKEICKTGETDVTYNELIVLLALNNKKSYVGTIHSETLIDKGLIVRVLNSLIDKKLVEKLYENKRNKYVLSETGSETIFKAFIERNHLADAVKVNQQKANEATDVIIELDKQLQGILFDK